MQERRHGADSEATPGRAGGAAASGPGKTTQVQLLGHGAEAHAASEPHASAARHKKKGLLEVFHEQLEKAKDKIVGKVADKISSAPERALEKLLKKLEDAANDEIGENLRPNDKSCLNQESINAVEAAINTTRLIAAFHMIHDLDKAVLAEMDTLKSDESTAKKGLALLDHITDALEALNTYGEAIRKANAQYDRLLKQAARCRPVARINPNLKPLIVPQQLEKLPGTIHLPPDIHHPTPIKPIGVPGLLIG